MALTQEELDALQQAMFDAAAGREWAKTITIADRTVTFHSLDEIAAFIEKMQARTSGSLTRYAATRKGLR